jgi:hypothetical protein
MSADGYRILRNPAAAPGTVAYTGTAGDVTQTIRGNCVMIWCTTAAYVTIGTTATTANGTPIPANVPIWLPLPTPQSSSIPKFQGEGGLIISAIQISSGGTMYCQQFAE